MASHLPTPAGAKSAWTDIPPDPLEAPELYEGVLWRRSLAFFVDLLLISVVGILVWGVLAFLAALSLGVLAPVAAVAMALFPAIYAAATIGGGAPPATPGMRLFGLRVLDWTGRPAGYAQAFLMAILFYASVALTSWLILVVALFTKRGRTVHDMLAGTVVVRRPYDPEAAHTI